MVNNLKYLNVKQKQNIFLVLLLLILPMLVKALFMDSITEKLVRNNPYVSEFHNISAQITSQHEFFELLKNDIQYYDNVDIIRGVSASDFNSYFYKKVEEKVEPQVEVSETVEESEEIFPSSSDLSLIYIGSSGNIFVVIEGKTIKLGGRTSGGFLVKKIEKNRVLLQGKRSSKWLTLKI